MSEGNKAVIRQLVAEVLLDAIAEVTSWRRPDVVFDDHTEVDLGGRTVEPWHFGPGNSLGDTVVWVPEARAAWTGNLLAHRRTAPCCWRADPPPTSTPWPASRAPWTSGRSCRARPSGGRALPGRLDGLPPRAAGVGDPGPPARLSALATVETVPLPRGHGFPRWHPAARMNWLAHDLHRLNVLATCRDLERQPTAARAQRQGAGAQPARQQRRSPVPFCLGLPASTTRTSHSEAGLASHKVAGALVDA